MSGAPRPLHLLNILGTAAISVALATTAACSGTGRAAQLAIQGDALSEAATAACKTQVTRFSAHEDDQLLSYLAHTCKAIITDLATSKDLDDASRTHGAHYLEALVEYDAVRQALEDKWKAGGEHNTELSPAGDFLVAREVGVMHHFNLWYQAILAREEAADSVAGHKPEGPASEG